MSRGAEMTSEPRTRSGRVFLEAVRAMDSANGETVPVDWLHAILAIEAEAAEPAALDVDPDLLAEAIEEMFGTAHSVSLARELWSRYTKLARLQSPDPSPEPADTWRDTGNRGAAEHKARSR